MSSFEFFKKNNTSSKRFKRKRLIITFIFVNTIQYAHNVDSNIYHLNKRGLPPFFHSETNPVLGHVLVHSVDKTHVLVETVKFIWLLLLNILSSNFFQHQTNLLDLISKQNRRQNGELEPSNSSYIILLCFLK